MEKISLSEKRIEELRRKVSAFQDSRRFSHTLGVEKEAVRLGELFLPEDINRLRVAALLHDITKMYDYEKQLKCCSEFGIMISGSEKKSPSLLHAITGAAVAERDFSDCADSTVIGAVRWHTTGRENMTLFEMIIYLADYIEETRTFEDCVSLRRYFYDGIRSANTMAERLEVLRKAMIRSFDMTVKALISEGKPVDRNTVDARNWFILNEISIP